MRNLWSLWTCLVDLYWRNTDEPANKKLNSTPAISRLMFSRLWVLYITHVQHKKKTYALVNNIETINSQCGPIKVVIRRPLWQVVWVLFLLSFSCGEAKLILTGHFRVVFCLCVKTNLCAKPFILEMNSAYRFIFTLSKLIFVRKVLLAFKLMHKITRRWPIVRRKKYVYTLIDGNLYV